MVGWWSWQQQAENMRSLDLSLCAAGELVLFEFRCSSDRTTADYPRSSNLPKTKLYCCSCPVRIFFGIVLPLMSTSTCISLARNLLDLNLSSSFKAIKMFCVDLLELIES